MNLDITRVMKEVREAFPNEEASIVFETEMEGLQPRFCIRLKRESGEHVFVFPVWLLERSKTPLVTIVDSIRLSHP